MYVYVCYVFYVCMLCTSVCLSVCVCMHVCMSVCVCMCVLSSCLCVSVCKCMVFLCARVHVCMTCGQVRAWLSVGLEHVCVYVCVVVLWDAFVAEGRDKHNHSLAVVEAKGPSRPRCTGGCKTNPAYQPEDATAAWIACSVTCASRASGSGVRGCGGQRSGCRDVNVMGSASPSCKSSRRTNVRIASTRFCRPRTTFLLVQWCVEVLAFVERLGTWARSWFLSSSVGLDESGPGL